MIKRVYIAILISLLAISCSKSVVEPGGVSSGDKAINFTIKELCADWASKSSTKGTIVDDINKVGAIMVYAFMDGSTTEYINNAKATIDAKNIWNFNPAYYYPQNGTLDFLTYTPEVSADNGLTQELVDNKTIKFTYNTLIEEHNQPDFMVGEPQKNYSGTNPLGAINFQHTLTQLRMSAKVASATDENRYKITSFTLHNITTIADMTYSVDNGMSNWTKNKAGDFIASDLGGILLNNKNFKSVMIPNQTLFMIPQEITDDATIEITIEDTKENSGLTYRTAPIVLPKTNWVKGEYIDLQFTFDVNDEDLVIPMTLEAKLRPWYEIEIPTEIDAYIYAHLSVSSVPKGETDTELTLYTNGEVKSVTANGEISSASLGTPASGTSCPITVKAAKAGTGSITVVINNSQGKTITKTFKIIVQ